MVLPGYTWTMRTAKGPTELGFTRYDRPRLEKALRGATEARDFRRLQAVLLIARGRPIAEVAEITCVSKRSVYVWLRRYLRRHQVEDLTERPRSGRPTSAEAITDDRIRRKLAESPMTLGYSTTTWTVRTLANHMSRTYDCQITEQALRRRMRDMGLCWKRPRYTFSTKDPHRAQKKGLSCGASGGSSPTP
jgi:transposase